MNDERRDPEAHWEELLRKEFANESDRACVILGAALLDSALETLLKARLVPCSSSDTLFEGSNPPLASFSARIDFAHRLGLISARFARDLHIIRKIRNDFAHNITGCSLEDSSVKNRVLELNRSHNIFKGADSLREHFPPGTRGEFQAAISWMQWHLREMTQETDAIRDPKLEWGYMPLPPSTPTAASSSQSTISSGEAGGVPALPSKTPPAKGLPAKGSH